MTWFLSKKDMNLRFRQLNYFLTESFTSVRKDNDRIYKWLDYFYKKSNQQEQTIKQLQLELQYIPKTPEEIKKVIDSYYSFENFHLRLEEINRKLELLEHKSPASDDLKAQIDHINRKIELLEHQGTPISAPKTASARQKVREKILKKITQNSKDYVKNLILSLIRKYDSMSGLQLKEIVVEEQGLCSKSSFYRLLTELEQDKELSVIKEGKEKRYFSKILTKQ